MKHQTIYIMKYLHPSLLSLALTLCCMTGFCSNTGDNAFDGNQTGNLTFMVSPDLKELADTWVLEYKQTYPAVQINLIDLPAEGKTTGGIFLVSDSQAEALDAASWKMCLGHHAIVAVINSKNPLLQEILEKGLKAEDFAMIYTSAANQRLHPYLVNNDEIIAGVAAFTKTSPAAIKAEMMTDTPSLVTALQGDPLAIGFCRLSDITMEGETGLAANLRLAPVDKNGNGRIDSFENIYDNLASFARGIWIGKYPAELSGTIYAVSNPAPADATALAFLTWISSNGGKYMSGKGFTALNSMEIKTNLATLALLSGSSSLPASTGKTGMWLYIVLTLVAVASIIALLLIIRSRTTVTAAFKTSRMIKSLNADMVTGPHGYYFDKSHTWAYMEKNGNIRMGIDDFLRHVTGHISRIMLKENGTEIRRGEKILTLVKEGKQLNIYAPVSGIIKSRNNILQKNASMVNSDPYLSGWIYEIEPKNWLREIQLMFMGESYFEWMKEEFVRLRGFFETALFPQQPEHEYVILQDGGELKDHVLADLGPEIWEEFQTKFIDKSR
jgi:glycine cleavage system H lipoate-binding protein/ABC-type phosphate transport system substrate-binding protein